MQELEQIRGKSVYEQEAYEKFKEKLQQKENDLSALEAKLHETTLQLELQKQETLKYVTNQDKQRNYLERTHIEYEKLRDKFERVVKEMERMRQNPSAVNTISPSQTMVQPAAINLNPADRGEIERLRERLEKTLQVRSLYL